MPNFGKWLGPEGAESTRLTVQISAAEHRLKPRSSLAARCKISVELTAAGLLSFAEWVTPARRPRADRD
jgi:hypothetical protein